MSRAFRGLRAQATSTGMPKAGLQILIIYYSVNTLSYRIVLIDIHLYVFLFVHSRFDVFIALLHVFICVLIQLFSFPSVILGWGGDESLLKPWHGRASVFP